MFLRFTHTIACISTSFLVFPLWLHHSTFLPTIYCYSNFSTFLPTFVIFRFVCFLIAILVATRCDLTVPLTCISLVTNDVDYLFMCLLVICVSSLEKCQFKSFASIGLFIFFLLLNGKRSLYILESRSIQTGFATIFSHSVGFLFTFLIMSFGARQF